MTLDPRAMARALGGTARGRYVIAPGPGHSRTDRSLSIEIDPAAPDGFWCHSFAGDDWRECRDYVRQVFGVGPWKRRRGLLYGPAGDASRILSTSSLDEDASRTAHALNIWHTAQPGAGTIVARYLSNRAILLDRWPSSLRFHANCPFLRRRRQFTTAIACNGRARRARSARPHWCALHLPEAGRKLKGRPTEKRTTRVFRKGIGRRGSI